MTILSSLGKRLGVDEHVFMSILNRFIFVILGVGTLVLVPLKMSPEEQGYFFTFNNLVALQLFFEMGLNFVLAQFVSHEAVKLKYNESGNLVYNSPLSKILSIIKMIRETYKYLSSLYFLIVLLVGWCFFELSSGNDNIAWWPIWLAIVISASINLYFSPYLSVAEGANYVSNISKLRIVQSLVGNILFWLGLILGFGLYAAPLILISSSLCTTIWYYKNVLPIFKVSRKTNFKNIDIKINWKEDIYPFQWRIALSWISGYFIFQVFNPIAFHFIGPSEAGKLGLTLAAYSAVLTLSFSWVNAKMPVLGGFFSEGKQKECRAFFFGVLIKSSLLSLVGGVVLTIIIYALKMKDYEIGDRFLPINSCMFLVIVIISNHIIFSIAAFYRANKKERFVWISMMTGGITTMSLLIAAQYGVSEMILAYFIVIFLINLPISIYVYNKFES